MLYYFSCAKHTTDKRSEKAFPRNFMHPLIIHFPVSLSHFSSVFPTDSLNTEMSMYVAHNHRFGLCCFHDVMMMKRRTEKRKKSLLPSSVQLFFNPSHPPSTTTFSDILIFLLLKGKLRVEKKKNGDGFKWNEKRSGGQC